MSLYIVAREVLLYRFREASYQVMEPLYRLLTFLCVDLLALP